MLKILYLVNADWFFLSHRLHLALAAKSKGAKVWVASSDTGKAKEIQNYGLNFIPVPFTRKGTNILRELFILPKIYRIYASIKPDIVHHVTIKPVLYGSLIAKLNKNLATVNAITGLGYVFSEGKKKSLILKFIKLLYKFSLNNERSVTIFQNPDDLNEFLDSGLVKQKKVVLIKGSGVDCKIFKPIKRTENEMIITLAARMIWDKGIGEFVDAAAIVKRSIPNSRFVLIGEPDEGNPNAVSIEKLKDWDQKGIVEWWGHCNNMAEVLQKATIVVLPTYYREGVPKILIEAAATGKAIITTDSSGCREIVKDNINGFLIPGRNSKVLSDKIIYLLKNPEIAQRFGEAGREIAVNEFSNEIVISSTLEVYRKLVNVNW